MYIYIKYSIHNEKTDSIFENILLPMPLSIHSLFTINYKNTILHDNYRGKLVNKNQMKNHYHKSNKFTQCIK